MHKRKRNERKRRGGGKRRAERGREREREGERGRRLRNGAQDQFFSGNFFYRRQNELRFSNWDLISVGLVEGKRMNRQAQVAGGVESLKEIVTGFQRA